MLFINYAFIHQKHLLAVSFQGAPTPEKRIVAWHKGPCPQSRSIALGAQGMARAWLGHHEAVSKKYQRCFPRHHRVETCMDPLPHEKKSNVIINLIFSFYNTFSVRVTPSIWLLPCCSCPAALKCCKHPFLAMKQKWVTRSERLWLPLSSHE